jgi:hypothetical protein
LDCTHRNTTEPFEMDGSKNGEYQAEGLWWVSCRDCGKTVPLDREDWPIHQPPAPEAPIPGIHHYSGCEPGGDWDSELGRYTGEGPRVKPDGICEGCGERACPVCGKGGEAVACPDCKRGKVHYLQACCACGLRWDDLEAAAQFWTERSTA